MDGVISPLATFLLEKGTLGAIVLGLIYLCYTIDKRAQADRAAALKYQGDILKALIDSTNVMREVTSAQERATEARKENTQGLKELAETIEGLERAYLPRGRR